jgi:hypothetical protein
MIMNHSINTAIRGSLPKTPTSAKAFMAKIEEYFQGSYKANASMLMTKMMHTKGVFVLAFRHFFIRFWEIQKLGSPESKKLRRS